MVFWLLAIAVTAIACAILYYASSGRTVNAAGDAGKDATTAHFRQLLDEIAADLASGRMLPAEAEAARAELAREVLRHKQKAESVSATATGRDRLLVPLSLAAVVVLAFGIYWGIGNPQLPAQPLAGRAGPAEAQVDLQEAIARIEARLAAVPDDLRGWSVIAPVYLQMGRFDDAVTAFRRVNELGQTSADSETDLAEALILQNGGQVTEEARALLESAVKRDPAHVKSRFYLAGELTRAGEFEPAIALWNQLLALSTGQEPWLETARNGLAAAQAGLNGGEAAPANDAAVQDEMIRDMVQSLSERLSSQGGTLEEWTRLVRSHLVLGDTESAQQAYDAAKAAYPEAGQRAELDALAAQAGLK